MKKSDRSLQRKEIVATGAGTRGKRMFPPGVMQQQKASRMPPAGAQPVQREESGNTHQTPSETKSAEGGLPGPLKSGIESLSGYRMDDVQVHYNSSQPAQLQAHAYAQGNQIHLGPGQEKHLPHEAWHVVQQKQGRVRPTMQMKSQVAINDEPGLEHEADVMGAKAAQMKAVPSIEQPQAIQRLAKGVCAGSSAPVQGVFNGYVGLAAGAWGLDNSALPGNLDVYPGGANLNIFGQQAGGTTRTINIASRSPYAGPKKLGGFNHFSMQYGNRILRQPGGAAKRYTHLHIINGKTHGPGAQSNLTLGSTGDNNAHRAQVEDAIRNGLAAADTATPYVANMALAAPNFRIGDVAYWNAPGGLAMVGAQAAGPGARKMVMGAWQNYTHFADWTAVGKLTRWVHYRVAPVYKNVLSPNIRANITHIYTTRHEDVLDDIDLNYVVPLAPGARPAARLALNQAKVAMNGKVTAGNLAGGAVAAFGTLVAGNALGKAKITAHFGAGSAEEIYYDAKMPGEAFDMAKFGAWATAAFPQDLTCDANLYTASYNPANIWYKIAEPQTTIPINRV